MKTLRYITAGVLSFIVSGSLLAQSNKPADQAIIKKALDSRNYKFIAQYIQPLSGGQRYLNYNYDVRVRPDSVIAYLPYFGTIQFAPPYNPTDDGVKFTSTRFDYQVSNKKGKYIITINFKDAGYNRRMIINTSPNGYASVQVLITNRTPVFYTGYITIIDNKQAVSAQNNQQQ